MFIMYNSQIVFAGLLYTTKFHIEKTLNTTKNPPAIQL